ncbi:MAG: glycosyltransferase [Pseudomonadales bacterium]
MIESSKKIMKMSRSILNFEFDRSVRQQQLDYVRALTKPSARHPEYRSSEGRSFLAICHDQDVDRRILQEIEALSGKGWSGVLVAMSDSVSDEFDTARLSNGVSVPIHRIGHARIVPDCEAYWAYQRRQSFLSANPILSKLNSRKYQRDLWRLYKCRAITHPLPFDGAFLGAGSLYPADLIVAHDLTALKAGAELAEKWNAPLIYDSHEFYPEQVVFSDYQKSLMRACEARYLPVCDQIITVSDSIAKAMAKNYGLERTPSVITNVTKRPARNGRKTAAGLRERVEHLGEGHIILYQGGMVRNRNLETLLAGFLNLARHDAHLVFLGPRDPVYANELSRLAKSSIYGRNVHMVDAVPQQELLDVTQTASFGVIPYAPVDLNTRYCMPNKLFEFIQARLPVVANEQLEEVSRLVSSNEIGRVGSMSTPREMADTLQSMLSENLDRYRSSLVSAASAFSWEAVEDRFLEIVEEAMCRPTRTS